MLAANYDITLDRAADYSFVLTIRQADGITPVNITGATFYADIRDVKTKAQATTFTAALTTPLAGIATLSLSKTLTKTLRAGMGLYEYDIFADINSVRRRLLYGSVSVRPQATNDV
jgi:hypothetical protein